VTTDTTGVTRERRSRRPRPRDAHGGSALPPIATEMVSPEKWCRGDAQSLDRSGAERIVEPRAPTGHSQHNRSNHCRRRRLCPRGRIKEGDDAISGSRYALMMLRYGQSAAGRASFNREIQYSKNTGYM
jgi:hypothetical protein